MSSTRVYTGKNRVQAKQEKGETFKRRLGFETKRFQRKNGKGKRRVRQG